MPSPRLPAPPPPGSRPCVPSASPEDDDDLPLDGDLAGEDDEVAGEETDETLRQPDAWPDDDDEPTEALLEPDLDELSPLDDLGDDEDDEDDLDLLDPGGVPLDDLDDLEAPDDTDVPVIPWELEVGLDGRPVPARIEPGRARTAWLRASGGEGEREVALRIAGQLVRVAVECLPSDQEVILLGRDVLSGRFLLRP